MHPAYRQEEFKIRVAIFGQASADSSFYKYVYVYINM